jgi:ABC-2 type transport system permease protein
MTALAVAGTALRRLARDRTALFFLVVLPVLIILIIGVSITDQAAFRIGVVGGAADAETRRIAAALDGSPALDVRPQVDVDGARTALRRGELDAVVVLPAGADEAVAAGTPVEMAVLGQQTNATHRAAQQAVAATVAEHGAVLLAAELLGDDLGGSLDEQLDAIRQVADRTPPVEVRRVVVDAESGYLPAGFSYSAPTMLVLFVFITSLAGGASLIESRRLGIHDRMLAGPVTPADVVAGETASFALLALVQSAIIVVVGAAAFGVDWGDPFAAGALIGVWALVGTGAGVLAGTLFRTPEQASAIGVTVGMVAGMLGGCMWPLEIVGDTMRTLGHALPHAWAVDGWIEILSRGGGIGDIATSLAVLAGFAAVLLASATWRLRTRLT